MIRTNPKFNYLCIIRAIYNWVTKKIKKRILIIYNGSLLRYRRCKAYLVVIKPQRNDLAKLKVYCYK